MVADGPDEDNRCAWINEGEQQAAIKGGRRPQRRGLSQPEGARKQGPVCHSRVAEEAVDGVEKDLQPAHIFAGDPIACSDALPESVVIFALARSGTFGSRAEDAEVMKYGKTKRKNSDEHRDA